MSFESACSACPACARCYQIRSDRRCHATVAIELLKDKEWQAWFKSQPFRIDKYASDGSLVDGAIKPTPHKSQEQMISRLDDALKEAKGG